MLVVALMLAVWRNKIDTLYGPQVPAIERGVIIGAVAMLFWPIMDYGYQQTSDVLFGNYYGGFNPRWSLVIAPWAILLLFFFLRRFGKNLAMVGQMGGIAGGLFAVLRYQDVNNWAQRFLGGGAEQWMAYVYAGLAVIGLALLLWPRKAPQRAGYPHEKPHRVTGTRTSLRAGHIPAGPALPICHARVLALRLRACDGRGALQAAKRST